MPVTRSSSATGRVDPAQENAMNRRLVQKTRAADTATSNAIAATRRPLGAMNSSLGARGKTQTNLPVAAQPRVIAKPKRLTARPTNQNTTNVAAKPVLEKAPVRATTKPKAESTPKLQRGFSAVGIPDVDASDDNPLMVASYAGDIYSYLKQLELDQSIKPDYLRGHQISARMRGVLVDWLVQVQIRFQLLPETLQMAIALVDRYLQDVDVVKDHLQLVGTTALFIAAKYEEIYPPEITEFSFITDNAFNVLQIREQERSLLRQLDFNIGRPVPIHFLRRYSKAIDANTPQHMLAKYLIELSLIDYPLCQLRPSLLAAAASFLATSLIPQDIERRAWMPILQYYSGYSIAELKTPLSLLGKMLLKVLADTVKTKAVRRKYSSEKFARISEHNCLTVSNVSALVADLVTTS